jgi:hypothetical protein
MATPPIQTNNPGRRDVVLCGEEWIESRANLSLNLEMRKTQRIFFGAREKRQPQEQVLRRRAAGGEAVVPQLSRNSDARPDKM